MLALDLENCDFVNELAKGDRGEDGLGHRCVGVIGKAYRGMLLTVCLA